MRIGVASKSRQRGCLLLFFWAPLATCVAHAEAPYVDARICANCHPRIAQTYALTGMARSFRRSPEAPEVRFYHSPSDTWYAIERKQGKLVQRRWRVGPGGAEVLADESSIDYLMGSGNHVKTFLHRNQRGALTELPLAWYAEHGGTWAMEPGYDGGSLPPPRQIAYECMFCHNAYPQIPPGHDEPGAEPLYSGELPQGIDCQRCHGPGGGHVRAAQQGMSFDAVRRAIVNPARLSPERQMEVCLQCHLETTSQPLPHSIVRYGRGPFSYRPGEPLADFELFFDRAPGSGHDDDFEIAHSAYRFRKSQCFLKSGGRLTCTTCHNPHDIPRGAAARAHYNGVCSQCHGAGVRAAIAGGKHTAEANCIGCHMPKRRTQDVVHAVMTDHFIGRRPPAGDPLAPMPESQEFFANPYRGEVVPYYPPALEAGDGPLYEAVAQVTQRSNPAGIARLASELARQKPAEAQFYIELGQALLGAGDPAAAVQQFEQAANIKPESRSAASNLADALTASGEPARAVVILTQALQTSPADPLLWHQLGIAQAEAGNDSEALRDLQKCLDLDPGLAEAHNALAERLASAGNLEGAEREMLAALRIEPDFAEALANYGHLLAMKRDNLHAVYYLARAVRLRPRNAAVLTNYAVVLAGLGRLAEARQQIDSALQADPRSAFAQLTAGRILVAQGDRAAAKMHLEKAAEAGDPDVKRLAGELLRQLGY